jgi:hypothetical protein
MYLQLAIEKDMALNLQKLDNVGEMATGTYFEIFI